MTPVDREKLAALLRQRDQLLGSTRGVANDLAEITQQIDEILCGMHPQIEIPPQSPSGGDSKTPIAPPDSPTR